MTSPPPPGAVITKSAVAAERQWLLEAAEIHVALINRTREALGRYFDEDVDSVTERQFVDEIDDVFGSPARAANVTALIRLTRGLDVVDDYPGFIVDELLGRQLASTIAGGEPAATLAEATFHFIDVWYDAPDDVAGRDDLDAGIAAGFQTRLPGWKWRDEPSPFDASS